MSEQIPILFDELSQLVEQYKIEVPSGRRAWPVSVKERVKGLLSAGSTYQEISNRSGISIATIYSWRFRAGGSEFLPVKIVAPKSKPIPTVTVRKSDPIKPSPAIPTVTVVMPSGLRIEGLPSNDAVALISQLELRSGK